MVPPVCRGSRLDIAASAHLPRPDVWRIKRGRREEEATKWTHQRLSGNHKLNAADAKHIEEAFRGKLLSFAIHQAEGASTASTADGCRRNAKSRDAIVTGRQIRADTRGEPRRIRDREHVRFVAQQACLVCGRQPCDAHHLRFAQNRALGRRASDEFTVPLCRGHHRELHRHGDEAAWWHKVGLDPTRAARALWLETHPLGANKFAAVAADPDPSNGVSQ